MDLGERVPRPARPAAPRRWSPALLACLLSVAAATIPGGGCGALRRAPAPPRLDAAQRELNLRSFEYAWETIRDKHWDPELNGVDWPGVRDEFLPRIAAAETMAEARAAMVDMLSRLDQSHFGIFPPDAYEVVAEASTGRKGQGGVGLEARVIEDQALVTRLEPGSPAEQAGVGLGWEILAVEGKKLAPSLARIREQFQDKTTLEVMLAGIVAARLEGEIGDARRVLFRDGEGREVTRDLVLVAPRGRWSQLGNLPPLPVWIEARRIEERVGYIAFNVFLDPQNLMETFSEAVASFMDADGIIIDVRGNPGGIGAMAMGMAGWFVEEKGRRLGTMHTRGNEMNFVVSPRARVFSRSLAILQDGASGSTTEIFAGGLQDLGRARVFGTRSAGAVLPAMIERLPNGDGFLYAIANYVSAAGAVLEGHGVLPDVEAPHTRAALLAGRDAALEAALAWIREAS
ncbi:MAG: hypothetical protein FJY75_02310 [Candidatus Eisenbacteria bacterium]|uniref:Tail specific protease domain-containing protein n=1 Tax=Eiseniibacteriota bacterium TaxID=2212470 RepID=A0A937XA61_UNCEI|nr:hypothetical protein [Candidatus Eisenbacteria bacterium]